MFSETTIVILLVFNRVYVPLPQRGKLGYYALAYDSRTHELFYSENVTKSIGRISLDIENRESIIKGVGDVQGEATVQ